MYIQKTNKGFYVAFCKGMVAYGYTAVGAIVEMMFLLKENNLKLRIN